MGVCCRGEGPQWHAAATCPAHIRTSTLQVCRTGGHQRAKGKACALTYPPLEVPTQVGGDHALLLKLLQQLPKA